ncbi:TetR/AcrR family transcriptional regulator [Wenyingzhuangia aestuarii]|uniref:TetR/AcrR family transcriptional regulator n=1 Tax=Wenyingzhuangia aestuarii TaxID=1647582 RepID=UPI00143C2D88|nr:TetR/AcrR family transcriptional regulator [Wenyingzhuangia aestuarii]NJB83359.1 AcrR family transcriptional regulator [Wenyingzhuangia aestuarii]
MAKASNTRQTILKKSFELIYQKGYQATSIDEIIATTQVTKGAFYYHFKTKDAMGIAIINEIVKPIMERTYITPLQTTLDPLAEIYTMTQSLLLENSFLKLEYGCPAGNLAQEMTPWNVEFSKALHQLITSWQTAIEESLLKALENGQIRKSVNAKQVAYFVISSYWGIRNFGKVYNSTHCYDDYLLELKSYLDTLK